MSDSARTLYLASLDPRTELHARRLAEKAGIPDNDAMWLLLHEIQRATREVTSSANAAITNESFAQRLSENIGANIARDTRVVTAVATGVESVRESAVRAIRALEAALADVVRQRAAAPLASLAFAFALGLIVCCAVTWGAYYAGTLNGYDAGHRSGYHDGIISERNRK